MRLVRLGFGALGPFPDEHVLDLDELGASGLFLLEGPTGAGKSTLIDAVVFALYGKVASAGASEDRLRSAHAAPDAETYVDLTFSTGAGLFRVRRTPVYQRPKQRGAGTTTQQASVRLWKLTSPDAPGEILATRIDEAGLELQRIVGLDRTQFVQTVVLPQGEFAAFLRADPEHRRGLLQKVFGTEVFDRVQQRLERMRADARAAVSDAEQAVQRAVARFAGAAGEPFADAGASGEPIGDAAAGSVPSAGAPTPTQAASALTDRLEAQASDAGDAAALASAASASARTERDEVLARVASVRRRDALHTSLATLEAAEPEVAAAQERWLAAQLAAELWPRVERARSAAALVEERTLAHGAARAAASDELRATVGEGDAEVVLKALAAELEAAVGARGALARALELEGALPERRQDLESRAEAHAAARHAIGVERAELAALPGRRAEQAASLDTARELAATLGAARLGLATAVGRLEAAREVGLLTAQLERERERAAERAEELRMANDALAAAHRARLADLAGELAAALVPGEPCAVCGAVEHPAPATPAAAGPAPDPEAVERVRADAEATLRDVLSQVEALAERLAARREVAGGDQAEVEAVVEAAQRRVAEAEDAESRAAELREALAELDAELDSRRVALADREARLTADEARAAELRRELEEDELEVLLAADGESSVRLRDEAWRRRADQARAWSAALSALAEAERDLAAAERERDAALAEADRTVAQVIADRLTPAQANALRAVVDEHAAERARVTRALAEPGIASVAGLDTAEVGAALESAEAALAAAEVTSRERAAQAAVLRERADAAAAALVELVAADAAHRDARSAAAPVIRMANIATASGGEGALTLATYVLGQRFADLVAAANARLVGISDGRYELVRSTEREAVRTRRLGLAMQVLDHRTGSARDPRTLSGGETFYVSLCLALGLADVVTAEAGGVELGTLLIDEGFGALDAETLEVVLAELSRLRDGGRVVGVVSHVDALKGAIAERIEVRRRADGASTLTVRA